MSTFSQYTCQPLHGLYRTIHLTLSWAFYVLGIFNSKIEPYIRNIDQVLVKSCTYDVFSNILNR